jgi:hypothetical protein
MQLGLHLGCNLTVEFERRNFSIGESPPDFLARHVAVETNTDTRESNALRGDLGTRALTFDSDLYRHGRLGTNGSRVVSAVLSTFALRCSGVYHLQ